RARRRCLVAPVLTRQPAAAERGEGREAEALIGAQRQHLGLGRAVEQAVARLHPLEAREAANIADPEAARQAPGLDVAGPDVVQLARAAEVVERAEGLLERRRRIGLMAQEQVDALGPQPLEAGVDGAEERPPGEAAVVGPVAERIEGLRAE